MPLTLLLTALAAGYGAVTGALVCRAAYRLTVEPGEPWRKHCPRGHPVAGWVGPARCADCGGHRYGPGGAPAAVLGAAGCAALGWAVGARPELGVWLLVVPVAVLLAAVDRRVYRLPDVLTLPLAGGVAALLGAAALLPSSAGSWPRALLGGVVLGAAFLVLFVLAPSGGLGLGDVKLAIGLGVALGWYGWDVLLAGVFLGFLLCAGWGTWMVLARGAGRRTALPFGPFLLLGGLAGLLLGGITT